MRYARIAIAAALLHSGAAFAQCTSYLGGFGQSSGDYVNVFSTAAAVQTRLSDAAGRWNNGCPRIPNTMSNGLPMFQTGSATAAGMMNIEVRYHPGQSTLGNGTCTQATVSGTAAAGVTAGFIDVWQSQGPGAGGNQGADCTANYGPLIAHELGHFLNMGDQYTNPNFACGNKLMAFGTVPGSDECAFANQNWSTAAENYCTCCSTTGCSPIVVDLGDDGYAFTSVADGVPFDIDADGDIDRTAWTAPGGADAFLTMERNGRFGVQSAAELFGNHTPSVNGGYTDNGFAALAEFDSVANEGNGDGLIDERDAVWPLLRLWIDENHDGATDPDELFTLSAKGVVGIETHYSPAPRYDEHGNRYGMKGKAWVKGKNGGRHPIKIFDVIFVAQ